MGYEMKLFYKLKTLYILKLILVIFHLYKYFVYSLPYKSKTDRHNLPIGCCGQYNLDIAQILLLQ